MNTESHHRFSAALPIPITSALLLLALGSTISTYTRAAVTTAGNVTPAPPPAGGNIAAPFLIGDVSFGQVSITSPTILNVTGGSTTIGDDANATGILSIDGVASALQVLAAAADVTVGNLGSAQLSVTNAAQILIADDFLVGAAVDSSGVVNISGLGTIADANDALVIGQNGFGVVNVLAGARLFVDDSVLGTSVNGQGRLTISGQQTITRQTNSMTVGDSGRGTLEVFDGAELETTNVVIGNASTSVGFADISGPETNWEVTGFMNLGVNGDSTLLVRNGARLTNTSTARMATINTGSRSIVEVNGFGSSWEIGTDLTVGEVGFGTLKILNGGQVVCDDVLMGDNLNSRGEAVVDGEFSYWEVNGTLEISGPGEAKLTISNGGFVTSTGVTRVNANGELVLDGGRLHAQIAAGFQNNGLTRGGGTIIGAVNNSATGEIRIEPTDKLLLHSITANLGLVDIHQGELEVLGTTTNSGDIDIRGGILRFQSGFSNLFGSQFAIVGGDVDAYGSITNNAGAQVIVGGEAQAVFHDTFTNNGSLLVTPGADLLTLDNLVFGTGSVTLELANTDPIDGFGQVAVGGTAQVSGELSVELVEGFIPSVGDSFQIITASSRSGFFTTETLPSLGAGLDWDVVYNPNSVVLNVVSTATLIGDYNDDGIVDTADYIVWRKLNNTAGPLPNDPSPGVNDGDYSQWRENFAKSGAGSGANNVPEPGSTVLIFASVLLVATNQRKQYKPLAVQLTSRIEGHAPDLRCRNLSRMPFTNCALWALPKRLANSTASLIAARSGVSV